MAYPRSSVDCGDRVRTWARRWAIWSRARYVALDAAMGTGAQGLDDLALDAQNAPLSLSTGRLRNSTSRRRSWWRRGERAASALAGAGHRGTLGDGIRHDRLGCVGGVEARWSATRSSNGVSTS